MLEFRTQLKEFNFKSSIHYRDAIFAAGSCFAENIGEKLSQHRFNSLVNPFGIIYHPIPLMQMLERVVANKPFSKEDIFKNNGLWHSWMHHGSFSHPDDVVMLEGLNASLDHAHNQLKAANKLLLTLGTSNGFYLNESGAVVANCHKMPGTLFEKKRTAISVLKNTLTEGLQKVLNFNDRLQVIITVSPVRHLRDGLVANNRSKAGLLILAEYLEQNFDQVTYFPSYELLIDDLRDYRFYAEDMTHPSPVAIDYIWKAFQNAFFEKETQEYVKEATKILKSLHHKPLFPGTENEQQFQKKLAADLVQFKEKWGIDFRP